MPIEDDHDSYTAEVKRCKERACRSLGRVWNPTKRGSCKPGKRSRSGSKNGMEATGPKSKKHWAPTIYTNMKKRKSRKSRHS